MNAANRLLGVLDGSRRDIATYNDTHEGEELLVRFGINAGEPIVEDDDLHGASVVIAKRLESEAETDGILVSDVVRQAVAGKDFEFEDRGEVELKGLDDPVALYRVSLV